MQNKYSSSLHQSSGEEPGVTALHLYSFDMGLLELKITPPAGGSSLRLVHYAVIVVCANIGLDWIGLVPN